MDYKNTLNDIDKVISRYYSILEIKNIIILSEKEIKKIIENMETKKLNDVMNEIENNLLKFEKFDSYVNKIKERIKSVDELDVNITAQIDNNEKKLTTLKNDAEKKFGNINKNMKYIEDTNSEVEKKLMR